MTERFDKLTDFVGNAMGNQSLILVVDDEADIREILGMQIQDLGFEFVEAEMVKALN